MSIGMCHLPTAARARRGLTERLLEDESRLGLDRSSTILAGVGVSRDGQHQVDAKPFMLSVYLSDKPQDHPFLRAIPEHFEGMNVRAISVGGVPSLAIGPSRGRVFDPVRPGCSISSDDGPAGTLGCFLGDGEELYLLSAAHVLCGVQVGAKSSDHAGRAVHQCALPYGASGSRKIGEIVRWEMPRVTPPGSPMHACVHDVALARIDTEIAWNLHVPGVGCQMMSGLKATEVGRAQVKKYGQDSGLTRGAVHGYSDTIRVPIPGEGEVWYEDVMTFLRRHPKSGERFCRPGDSGSIVWSRQRRPLGMLIASVPEAAFAIPWETIEAFTGMGMLQQSRVS